MMVFQFVGIQIFSIMYLMLILLVYSSKKRYVSAENDVFKVLLIFTLIELVVDIMVCYSIRYASVIPNINNFLCRFSLFGYHIWAALLMLYVLLIGNKKSYRTLKELYQKSFKVQVGTIVVTLLSLVVFLLPISYTYDLTYRISYVVGICTSYSYFITIIYLSIILFSVLLNKNKIPFVKRIPIFVFIITASIFLPIQRFNSDVPVLIVPLMAFAIMIMYFTLENPDVKLIDELNDLKAKAEEAGNIKTKFLDNVSHNIKSPMNAIIGYSQTILTENLSENAKKDSENINKSSRILLEMVNNTLDISKVESKVCKINEEKYSLKDLLININFLVINILDNKKVKFIMEVSENTPCNLIGDYYKLLKVLSNILSNAVKYTNVGKIIFSVSAKAINENVELYFKIKDTGVGIKNEEKEMIFKKFSGFENNETISANGTGIGLSLSKSIVELLGGNISFESTYGAGSTFNIKLSQKLADNEVIGKFNVNDTNYNISLEDYSNCNALIIDDNKYSAKPLNRMLGLYNISTYLVDSPEEYVVSLKNGNKYDIIFIEDKLVTENTFKTIQTYKNINNKDIVVIALSSDSLNASKKYFSDRGYDDYIIEPIDIIKLGELLNKFLKK